MYGHGNVALMNGGRKKWELEGRPLTTDAPAVSPTTYQSSGLDLTYRAYLKDVLGYVDQPGGRGLVDVRSPAEFNGEIIAPPGLPETAQRRGHVPGASNIPWVQAANEDGTFKSADELRALYGGKGISPDKEIITYCRIGERSSHSWFVLPFPFAGEELGRRPEVVSQADWGSEAVRGWAGRRQVSRAGKTSRRGRARPRRVWVGHVPALR